MDILPFIVLMSYLIFITCLIIKHILGVRTAMDQALAHLKSDLEPLNRVNDIDPALIWTGKEISESIRSLRMEPERQFIMIKSNSRRPLSIATASARALDRMSKVTQPQADSHSYHRKPISQVLRDQEKTELNRERCYNCGSDAPPQNNHCGHCGHPLEEVTIVKQSPMI